VEDWTLMMLGRVLDTQEKEEEVEERGGGGGGGGSGGSGSWPFLQYINQLSAVDRLSCL
jgi:hypothetical protein